ncbi:MAG: hypothetical protein A2W00_07515 [Candidatus Eisenbacteria bacterium RBG_16_71_46]|nr:MAG: hypothetical protein A2W00_07515 [Candidatus Eisenbacteria bacterium RBG_16_71_46]
MPQYIEKIRVPVRIAQPGQSPVEGFLSLASQDEFHSGPETILDLVNLSLRVFPFIREEDGAVLLVTRVNVDWVQPGPGVQREMVCPPNYLVTREERVQVLFRDGRLVDGLIQMELPEDLNRASDFLNGVEDFFVLVTDLGPLVVNKNHVLETRVFESSPMPLDSRAALG